LSLDRVRIDRDSPRLRRRRTTSSRRSRALRLILAAVLVGGVAGFGAVATNAFGMGVLYQRFVSKIERIAAGPPPDRATVPTVTVTPKPATPSPGPTPTLPPSASGQPPPTPAPTPTPIPRVAVSVNIVKHPDAVFAHELRDDWCAPAGVTTVLAILGLGDPTDAREREIAGRIREWESRKDSLNGEWGPAAMAKALEAYGAPGYKLFAYETQADALRGAAKAISTTHSPAILLAWRGAHTWVMSGYKADADPTIFDDAKVTGAYILDPWYPWNSSIWGQSDKPGTFQNLGSMHDNFLPWRRPEGHYPDRDGRFIVVVPTIPAG
jgi:hypothetical protein